MVQMGLGEAPPQPFQLRDYQQACVDALVEYRLTPTEKHPEGGKRAAIVMATGTGKTVVFSQFPNLSRKRVLIVAHREELLDQAADKILRANPGVSVGIEQAERHAAPGSRVVIASIQTLTVSQRRLEALDPTDFSVVIVDEVHHALARSYMTMLGHFGLVPDLSDLKDSQLEKRELSREVRERFETHRVPEWAPFLAGFTATPNRTDGRGLEYLLDDVVYSMSIKQGIEAGWLCPIRGIRVRTNADIRDVHTRAGDFKDEELSNAINTEERNSLVVQSYLEQCRGRQALCFCVDVKHTQAMTELFKRAGVRAETVIGATPRDDRQGVIAAYQRGEVQVLVNCMVLTEGFDAPETSAILMARPTKSSLLYSQMLGRGTRIALGKQDLLVLDFADTAKAGVASVNTLFGLPPKLALKGEDVLAVGRSVEEIPEVPEKLWDEVEDLPTLQRQAMEFDPLRGATLEPDVAAVARMGWAKTSFGYALGIPPARNEAGENQGEGGQVGVVVDMLGHVALRYKERYRSPLFLGTFPDAVSAVQAGEAWVTERRPDAGAFLDRNATWRAGEASQKQLDYLRRLMPRGVPVPQGISKGEASALIERYKARKTKAD